MANRFYSAPISATNAAAVTEAAAANAGPFVDVRVTYDATGNSKFNAIKALEAVAQKIQEGDWPPV